MSRDAEAKVDPKTARLYDKRTVERNIKKGLVSRKDYEKFLKSLGDVAEKGVFGAESDLDDDSDELDAADQGADDEGADDEPETSSSPDGAGTPHAS